MRSHSAMAACEQLSSTARACAQARGESMITGTAALCDAQNGGQRRCTPRRVTRQPRISLARMRAGVQFLARAPEQGGSGCRVCVGQWTCLSLRYWDADCEPSMSIFVRFITGRFPLVCVCGGCRRRGLFCGSFHCGYSVLLIFFVLCCRSFFFLGFDVLSFTTLVFAAVVVVVVVVVVVFPDGAAIPTAVSIQHQQYGSEDNMSAARRSRPATRLTHTMLLLSSFFLPLFPSFPSFLSCVSAPSLCCF